MITHFARPAAIALSLAALVSMLLTGCGADTQLDLSKACPGITQSNGIPECTQLYPGAVALQLPAGTENAPVGAIARGGAGFVTVAGKHIPLSDTVVDRGAADRSYANVVYRATITNGQITALAPLLRVSDDAILTHMFASKTLIGQISARQPDESYNIEPVLAVVVQLDAQAKDGQLHGQILNERSSVKTQDGTCIPALPSDASNPLAGGFTKDIVLKRIAAMHGSFDDEMVFAWNESSSGMGSAFYPSIATLLDADPIGSEWQIVQHGNPFSGPALRLQLGDGASVAAC